MRADEKRKGYIMKSKYLVCMAAMGLLVCTSLTAQAKTLGVDEGDGGIRYYTDGGAAYSVDLDSMTDEEREKWEAADRERKRESLAYLEKYGVTYDADTDNILYKGKVVRWLLDEQYENTYITFFSSKGEIDLYTVRDENSKLTGVREATKEEYDKQTEIQEINEKGSEEAYFIESSDSSYCIGEGEAMEGMITEEAVTTAVADGSGVLKEDEKKAEKKKRREYEEAGIGVNKNGCWTWEGNMIFMLMDDDGSMYQNGLEKAKEARIYIYVSRDDEGNIIKAEKITPKEILQKKADEE